MTELLKCPFCIPAAKIDCDNRFSNWFVECTKCFCKTPKHTTEFFAKVSWNTRKPVQDVLERLEKEKAEAEDKWQKFNSDISYGQMIAYREAIKIVKEGLMND